MINGRTYSSIYDAATRTETTTSSVDRQTTLVADETGVRQFGVAKILPFTIVYDTQGRPLSMAQGAGHDARTATLTYNTEGFMENLTDPLQRTVTFRYDPAGRVTIRILPDGREIHTTFDAKGASRPSRPPGAPMMPLPTPPWTRPSYTPPDVGISGRWPRLTRTTSIDSSPA